MPKQCARPTATITNARGQRRGSTPATGAQRSTASSFDGRWLYVAVGAYLEPLARGRIVMVAVARPDASVWGEALRFACFTLNEAVLIAGLACNAALPNPGARLWVASGRLAKEDGS